MKECFGATPKLRCETRALPLLTRAALYRRSRVFAVQLGNETGANFGGANCLTFVCIAAIAEAFGVHRADHPQHATHPFWMTLRQKRQMRNLRSSEKHGRSIWTGRGACAASDASSRVHCQISIVLGNQDRVRLRR